jgi:hypothetical protein
VTQTLVELIGMVILTRVVPAWLIPEPPDVPYVLRLVDRD